MPVRGKIFRLVTNPNFHRVYLPKYSEPSYETWIQCALLYPLLSLQVSDLETFPKKFGRENGKITSLKELNPGTVLL
jgi:hypothetical protein